MEKNSVGEVIRTRVASWLPNKHSLYWHGKGVVINQTSTNYFAVKATIL